MSYLVLDLETVPDLSRWSPPADKPDAFAPTWAQRIVCVGYVHLSKSYELNSLGVIREDSYTHPDPAVREHHLLAELTYRVGHSKPTLVTYNGRSFDLPVIAMRALCHDVPIAWYYARDVRYRYTELGHLDLCDALADYGASKMATLDVVAKLIGLPGKVGCDGSQVAELYAAGRLDAIADYCLADVAQTAMLLIHFRGLQGAITIEESKARRGDLLSAFKREPSLRAVFTPPAEAERHAS